MYPRMDPACASATGAAGAASATSLSLISVRSIAPACADETLSDAFAVFAEAAAMLFTAAASSFAGAAASSTSSVAGAIASSIAGASSSIAGATVSSMIGATASSKIGAITSSMTGSTAISMTGIILTASTGAASSCTIGSASSSSSCEGSYGTYVMYLPSAPFPMFSSFLKPRISPVSFVPENAYCRIFVTEQATGVKSTSPLVLFAAKLRNAFPPMTARTPSAGRVRLASLPLPALWNAPHAMVSRALQSERSTLLSEWHSLNA